MNILTTALAAIASVAIVSAQAPPAPQVPSPPVQPPNRTQGNPEAKPTPATVTMIGCLERSRLDGSSATPGVVGTTGAAGDSGFILTKVVKPAETTGPRAPLAATPGATYRLDADESQLSGYVGRKVEVAGAIVDRSAASSPSTSGSPNALKLKVETIKTIDMNCTE